MTAMRIPMKKAGPNGEAKEFVGSPTKTAASISIKCASLLDATALITKAIIFNQRGMFGQALNNLYVAHQYLSSMKGKKHNEWKKIAAFHLGVNLYGINANREAEALKYLHEALPMYFGMGEEGRESQAYALLLIGKCERRLNKYPEAIKHLNQAYVIFKNLLKTFHEQEDADKRLLVLMHIADTLTFLGECYLAQKQYKHAHQLFYKAREILTNQVKQANDPTLLPINYELDGIAQTFDQLFINAVPLLEAAYKMFEQRKDEKECANVAVYLGICYFKLGDKNKAAANLSIAATYYKRVQDSLRLSMCTHLLECLKITDSVLLIQKHDEFLKYLKTADALTAAELAKLCQFVITIDKTVLASPKTSPASATTAAAIASPRLTALKAAGDMKHLSLTSPRGAEFKYVGSPHLFAAAAPPSVKKPQAFKWDLNSTNQLPLTRTPSAQSSSPHVRAATPIVFDGILPLLFRAASQHAVGNAGGASAAAGSTAANGSGTPRSLIPN